MADIFEEVEEGIRQDRLQMLWKRYGILAYVGAGLLLGGVGLNEYLKSRAVEEINGAALTLEAALDDLDKGEYQMSGDALAQLASSDARLAPIAAHFLAQVRFEGNGDATAAAEVLAQSAEGKLGPEQKLALLKAAYLVANESTRSDLEARLAPLRQDESAFGALAIELIAAKAMEEGDAEFARTEFSYLRVAPNVPDGVAKRAQRALASLPPVSSDPLMQTDPLTTPDGESTPEEETGE
ncbi:MAG: hypothetical protein GYB42_11735 [Alphaproteobacteria bacterium]|nr:hypothetical protein [Alphaproteobacteria bacterium]